MSNSCCSDRIFTQLLITFLWFSTNLARFKEAVASGHLGQELLNSSGDFPDGGIQNLPGMNDQGKLNFLIL